MDPRGDVLLALTMNGQPLPVDHGAPVRYAELPACRYASCCIMYTKKIDMKLCDIKQPYACSSEFLVELYQPHDIDHMILTT